MKQKRILIVRQDRIGDVVLSTHIPRAIKKEFPDSFIAVLVTNYTKDVYLHNPHVDKIIIYDDIPINGFKNFFLKVQEIRKFRFNYALMLLPSKRINYLLFYSGILHRVGVGQKFYQFITFVKEISRHKYIPLRHEADYCMDLVRSIGVQSNDLFPEIFLSETEQKIIRKIKANAKDKNKLLIGINSTNKNSSPNLNFETYLNLIKRLQKDDRFQVVLTDYEIPSLLQNLEGVEYPNEGLPLRKSIVNIGSLDYLISSSTGPMHIAAALGVKTISAFCTLSACSSNLWGPLGNQSKIISPDNNYCDFKCNRNPKICSFSGDGGINVGKILYALKEFIDEREMIPATVIYDNRLKVLNK